jgi:hypothetical protein
VNLSGNLFFDAVTGSPYYSGVSLIPNRPLCRQGWGSLSRKSFMARRTSAALELNT